MKGIEKGYRMYREGKGCETFEVTRNDNYSAVANGGKATVLIHYKGNPRLPVTRKSKPIVCGTGGCASLSTSTPTGTGSPLESWFYCEGSFTTPRVNIYEYTLTDADGVTTPPFRYTATCLPRGSAVNAIGGKMLSAQVEDGAAEG
jgi:hypothetical protein